MSDGSIRDDALRGIEMTLSEELEYISERLDTIAVAMMGLDEQRLPLRASLEFRLLLSLLSIQSRQDSGQWFGQDEQHRSSLCLLVRLWVDSFLAGQDKETTP